MTAIARALLFAAMPVLVYFALQRFEPREVGLVALGLLVLRAPKAAIAYIRHLGAGAWAACAVLMVLVALLWTANDPRWVLAYPVMMNLLMLSIFGATLIRPPSMIERLARLREPDLPPAAVSYTRKVTQVWCAFFVANGAVALWTVLGASRETWVLYNGLISYLLMGLLFAAEWGYRRWMVRAEAPQ